MHPACHVAAATLLLQPADAAEALAATQPALAEAVKIDLEYAPLEPAAENRCAPLPPPPPPAPSP